MKILDRIGLALFSTIVLILSIILCLMIFGWLKVDFVHEIVTRMLENQICSNILLGLSC